MSTEITWRTNLAVSNLHIAKALADQSPLIDSKLAETLSSPVWQFVAAVELSGVPPARFWRHLIPLAATSASRRQIIETTVTKAIGRGQRFAAIVNHLTDRLAEVDDALRVALPNHFEDLALRQKPLREQWEARGPGLLTQIGHLIEPAILPPNCEILPVHPAIGGGGEAHLNYNSLRIEAVLANPHADLPETLRLAWLIAQLQLDLPAYSEQIQPERLPHIARFAMLPPTLAAAETVELARLTPDSIATAITAWHLTVPQSIDAPALLADWWQTYQQSRPPFPIALAALDQLFG